MCVCVQPWTKGLPPPLFLPYMGRGTQHFTGTVSNEATSEMGYPAWPAGRTCSFFHKLLRQSSAFCFMVLHVFHPTNRFFQQPFTDLRRAARATDRLCRLEQQFLKHLQVFGPFTLRFFAILPIGEIELTEYKLSKCVPLSRPTRVLSVIPVTGAPILHGKATTPTHHHSLDSHRKAPTPSPNQLTYRPPGQKTVLEEYIGFQLSDFGSVISFHFFKSCACFHVLLD